MPEFSAKTILQCNAAALRDLLKAPHELPRISDPELELEIIEAPAIISEGDEIEFRISAYGFKQRMKHRYVVVTENEIVAEQLEGPARMWRHTQTILEHDDGTCRLSDHFGFEPPGGMLGFVMTEAKIRESLEEGMTFRYESIQEILGQS
jgi:ligand-binding SRPBCC domain-containing protein